MRFIKCEKGMAMPLVLMILLVLGMLGGTIFYYSTSEMNQAARDERIAQSQYLARSGAESLARYIMIEIDELDNIPDPGDFVAFEVELEFRDIAELGKLDVIMERTSSKQVRITGVGLVGGIEQRVSILLETNEAFDGLVYSMGSLNLNANATFEGGDIASGGHVKWYDGDVKEENEVGIPHSFDGNIDENVNIEFPDPIFPEPQEQFPPPENILNVNNNINPVLISASPEKAYSKIAFANNRKGLIIDASDNPITLETIDFEMPPRAGKLEIITREGNDINLIVTNINLRNLEITGDGIVYLYVREWINVQTPHAETILSETAQLVVYLDTGAQMRFVGNSQFEGLIYGPKADVMLNSNVKIKGAMIVNDLAGDFSDITQSIGSDQALFQRQFTWNMLEEIGFGEYMMLRWER